MKLFGEVAITTDLNGQMFNRGLNNINSLIGNVAQYRDLEMEYITEVLADYSTMLLDSTDGSADAGDELLLEDSFENWPGKILNETTFQRVTAESVINWEVEISEILKGAFASTAVMMEDGSLLTYETGSPINYENYMPDSIVDSVIEYLRILLATAGYPAEFFSLMSVKDVSNVFADSNLYLEYATDEGGTFLLEDGIPPSSSAYVGSESTEGNIFAEEVRTTITTSDPHYFHSGDEVYLDDFEGTDLEGINGSVYKVSDVDIENSKLLINNTDDPADAGDGILLEGSEFGYLSNEEIAIFTLSDPSSSSVPDDTDFVYDDFDISTATITSNGKIYRPAREMTAGIPISLLRKEYIGEYSSYVIDNYEHNCPADFSSLAADTVFNTRPRHLSIESNILLEDEEELLLEDGTTNSPNSSAIGKILADDGTLDIDPNYNDYELVISEGQEKVVHAAYVASESESETNIVLDSTDGSANAGGRMLTEDSIVQHGVIPFDQPFHYKGHPYENNNGFLYYNHKIDQRVSV